MGGDIAESAGSSTLSLVRKGIEGGIGLTFSVGGPMGAVDMLAWTGKVLCLLAALAVTNAHLVLVQAWAWTTMMQERLPERGVSEAFESTFGGEEPCSMCQSVKEERHEQQKEAPVPESSPLLKWVPSGVKADVQVYRPGVVFVGVGPVDGCRVVYRSELPEVPPPEFKS